jgi:hypothetical protein
MHGNSEFCMINDTISFPACYAIIAAVQCHEDIHDLV